MSETVKVKVIPTDALIDIQVNGAFYGRLQQLLMKHAKEKSPEEFTKVIAELKDREPQNEYEYHLITLLSLSYEINHKAFEQKKVIDEEVKVPPQNPSPEVKPQ